MNVHRCEPVAMRKPPPGSTSPRYAAGPAPASPRLTIGATFRVPAMVRLAPGLVRIVSRRSTRFPSAGFQPPGRGRAVLVMCRRFSAAGLVRSVTSSTSRYGSPSKIFMRRPASKSGAYSRRQPPEPNHGAGKFAATGETSGRLTRRVARRVGAAVTSRPLSVIFRKYIEPDGVEKCSRATTSKSTVVSRWGTVPNSKLRVSPGGIETSSRTTEISSPKAMAAPAHATHAMESKAVKAPWSDRRIPQPRPSARLP